MTLLFYLIYSYLKGYSRGSFTNGGGGDSKASLEVNLTSEAGVRGVSFTAPGSLQPRLLPSSLSSPLLLF